MMLQRSCIERWKRCVEKDVCQGIVAAGQKEGLPPPKQAWRRYHSYCNQMNAHQDARNDRSYDVHDGESIVMGLFPAVIVRQRWFGCERRVEQGHKPTTRPKPSLAYQVPVEHGTWCQCKYIRYEQQIDQSHGSMMHRLPVAVCLYTKSHVLDAIVGFRLPSVLIVSVGDVRDFAWNPMESDSKRQVASVLGANRKTPRWTVSVAVQLHSPGCHARSSRHVVTRLITTQSRNGSHKAKRPAPRVAHLASDGTSPLYQTLR